LIRAYDSQFVEDDGETVRINAQNSGFVKKQTKVRWGDNVEENN